ncbi:MAG: hypothetical protein ACLQVX_02835 [Limisphaerales bacterium]|jgi:hypothetical protein
MSNPISHDNIDQALSLLAGRLDLAQTDPVRLVICGGSALIAMSLRRRTTRDMDVVALLSAAQEPISPDPLPDFLLRAADQVSRDLGLFEGWLNNGPSRGEGGIFQMGLPEGFVGRLTEKEYGPRLAIYFIGRLDQIHFKLYAAADQRDGTHLNDLKALHPTAAELEAAARWAMTHDVSEGFKMVLKELLTQLGHESVAERI